MTLVLIPSANFLGLVALDGPTRLDFLVTVGVIAPVSLEVKVSSHSPGSGLPLDIENDGRTVLVARGNTAI